MANSYLKINRLNRIEGQVRGIAGMIEEGRHPMDILIQLKAIKSAIATVERNIIEDYINEIDVDRIDEIKQILKSATA